MKCLPVFLILLSLLAPSVMAREARLLTGEDAANWLGVGRVNISAHARRGMCTGTLIEPDLVLTAAHCLIHPRTNSPYQLGDIHFVAGWYKGEWAGHSKASAIAIHPDYPIGAPPSIESIGTDLALIRLQAPLSTHVPPFATGPVEQEDYSIISYRADRAHALSGQNCVLRQRAQTVLDLDCAVIEGASGAPVFQQVGDLWRVVAVLSAKGSGRAFAVSVTPGLDIVRELLSR